MNPAILIDDQSDYNQARQRDYYKKLLAYYGGTLPLDYYRRVNRGLEAQRKLKAYWREREGSRMTVIDSILPNNLITLKRTKVNAFP